MHADQTNDAPHVLFRYGQIRAPKDSVNLRLLAANRDSLPTALLAYALIKLAKGPAKLSHSGGFCMCHGVVFVSYLFVQ